MMNVGEIDMNILLIEDNHADAHLLTELMAENPSGPTIHWVTDGYQALDYIYQRGEHHDSPRPDAIMLDLGLPRVNGYEVLKQLKDNPSFASIPIIILTTSRNPLDSTQCNILGADAFLSKPHNLKGFEALADRLITKELPRLLPAAA